MNGQPCIRGMHIAGRRVLLELVTYGSSKELMDAHPSLEHDDIRQALLSAAANVSDRINSSCRRGHSMKILIDAITTTATFMALFALFALE